MRDIQFEEGNSLNKLKKKNSTPMWSRSESVKVDVLRSFSFSKMQTIIKLIFGLKWQWEPTNDGGLYNPLH